MALIKVVFEAHEPGTKSPIVEKMQMVLEFDDDLCAIARRVHDVGGWDDVSSMTASSMTVPNPDMKLVEDMNRLLEDRDRLREVFSAGGDLISRFLLIKSISWLAQAQTTKETA